MKILIIASNYPYSGHPASGIFNERCAMVLRDLCDHIEVVSPRPVCSTPVVVFGAALEGLFVH